MIRYCGRHLIVSLQNSINSSIFSPKNELDSYMNETYTHKHSNPLEYWAINRNKYSYLAKLVLYMLCCPATSVPSERVFSKAENILNKKRNRLEGNTLNMILLLNK